MKVDIVVTRHPNLIKYLLDKKIVDENVKVISHATIDDIKGKHVIGVLPFSLAVHADFVTEVPLRLSEEDRGKELSYERLLEIAEKPVTYKVYDYPNYKVIEKALNSYANSFG